MSQVLNVSQRDKAVFALRDIKGILEYTKEKPGFAELDEVQTILASHGLQIAPIVKPVAAPLVLAPAEPANVAPAPAISQNEVYWVERVAQSYRALKRDNKQGYVHKNDTMGNLLAICCKLAQIPFTK